MKKILYSISWCLCLLFAACSEEGDAYDPYANWAARNATYFALKADTARTEIAEAKALYGDEWEQHCDWRMYKSVRKSPLVVGALTDSICVRILERGTGVGSPLSTDTVWVNYRGTLIPVQMEVEGKFQEEHVIFSQSFVGELDLQVANPSDFVVGATVAGFSTALQHMHTGDQWEVYIPSALAYGSEADGRVPAYSTLKFFIHLVRYSD